MIQLSQGDVAIHECTFQGYFEKSKVNLRFPSLFFIEWKAINGKNTVSMVGRKKANNSLVELKETLFFTTEMLYHRTQKHYLKKQSLIHLNLISNSRPDQIKLVGRILINIAQVSNYQKYGELAVQRLTYCSVDADIEFKIKMITSLQSHKEFNDLDKSSFSDLYAFTSKNNNKKESKSERDLVVEKRLHDQAKSKSKIYLKQEGNQYNNNIFQNNHILLKQLEESPEKKITPPAEPKYERTRELLKNIQIIEKHNPISSVESDNLALLIKKEKEILEKELNEHKNRIRKLQTDIKQIMKNYKENEQKSQLTNSKLLKSQNVVINLQQNQNKIKSILEEKQHEIQLLKSGYQADIKILKATIQELTLKGLPNSDKPNDGHLNIIQREKQESLLKELTLKDIDYKVLKQQHERTKLQNSGLLKRYEEMQIQNKDMFVQFRKLEDIIKQKNEEISNIGNLLKYKEDNYSLAVGEFQQKLKDALNELAVAQEESHKHLVHVSQAFIQQPNQPPAQVIDIKALKAELDTLRAQNDKLKKNIQVMTAYNDYQRLSETTQTPSELLNEVFILKQQQEMQILQNKSLKEQNQLLKEKINLLIVEHQLILSPRNKDTLSEEELFQKESIKTTQPVQANQQIVIVQEETKVQQIPEEIFQQKEILIVEQIIQVKQVVPLEQKVEQKAQEQQKVEQIVIIQQKPEQISKEQPKVVQKLIIQQRSDNMNIIEPNSIPIQSNAYWNELRDEELMLIKEQLQKQKQQKEAYILANLTLTQQLNTNKIFNETKIQELQQQMMKLNDLMIQLRKEGLVVKKGSIQQDNGSYEQSRRSQSRDVSSVFTFSNTHLMNRDNIKDGQHQFQELPIIQNVSYQLQVQIEQDQPLPEIINNNVQVQQTIPSAEFTIPQAQVVIPSAEVVIFQAQINNSFPLAQPQTINTDAKPQVIIPQPEVVIQTEIIAIQPDAIIPQTDLIIPQNEVIIIQPQVIAIQPEVINLQPEILIQAGQICQKSFEEHHVGYTIKEDNFKFEENNAQLSHEQVINMRQNKVIHDQELQLLRVENARLKQESVDWRYKHDQIGSLFTIRQIQLTKLKEQLSTIQQKYTQLTTKHETNILQLQQHKSATPQHQQPKIQQHSAQEQRATYLKSMQLQVHELKEQLKKKESDEKSHQIQKFDIERDREFVKDLENRLINQVQENRIKDELLAQGEKNIEQLYALKDQVEDLKEKYMEVKEALEERDEIINYLEETKSQLTKELQEIEKNINYKQQIQTEADDSELKIIEEEFLAMKNENESLKSENELLKNEMQLMAMIQHENHHLKSHNERLKEECSQLKSQISLLRQCKGTLGEGEMDAQVLKNEIIQSLRSVKDGLQGGYLDSIQRPQIIQISSPNISNEVPNNQIPIQHEVQQQPLPNQQQQLLPQIIQDQILILNENTQVYVITQEIVIDQPILIIQENIIVIQQQPKLQVVSSDKQQPVQHVQEIKVHVEEQLLVQSMVAQEEVIVVSLQEVPVVQQEVIKPVQDVVVVAVQDQVAVVPQEEAVVITHKQEDVVIVVKHGSHEGSLLIVQPDSANHFIKVYSVESDRSSAPSPIHYDHSTIPYDERQIHDRLLDLTNQNQSLKKQIQSLNNDLALESEQKFICFSQLQTYKETISQLTQKLSCLQTEVDKLHSLPLHSFQSPIKTNRDSQNAIKDQRQTSIIIPQKVQAQNDMSTPNDNTETNFQSAKKSGETLISTKILDDQVSKMKQEYDVLKQQLQTQIKLHNEVKMMHKIGQQRYTNLSIHYENGLRELQFANFNLADAKQQKAEREEQLYYYKKMSFQFENDLLALRERFAQLQEKLIVNQKAEKIIETQVIREEIINIQTSPADIPQIFQPIDEQIQIQQVKQQEQIISQQIITQQININVQPNNQSQPLVIITQNITIIDLPLHVEQPSSLPQPHQQIILIQPSPQTQQKQRQQPQHNIHLQAMPSSQVNELKESLMKISQELLSKQRENEELKIIVEQHNACLIERHEWQQKLNQISDKLSEDEIILMEKKMYSEKRQREDLPLSPLQYNHQHIEQVHQHHFIIAGKTQEEYKAELQALINEKLGYMESVVKLEEKLNEEQAKYNERLIELQTQVKSKEHSLEELKFIITQLTQQTEEMKLKLIEKELQVSNPTSNNQNAIRVQQNPVLNAQQKQKISESGNLLQTMSLELEHMQIEVANKIQYIDELQCKIDELIQKIQTQEQTIKNYKQHEVIYVQTINSLKVSEVNIVKLQKQLEALHQTKNNSDNAVNPLVQEHNILVTEHSTLTQKHQALIQQNETLLTSHNEIKQQLLQAEVIINTKTQQLQKEKALRQHQTNTQQESSKSSSQQHLKLKETYQIKIQQKEKELINFINQYNNLKTQNHNNLTRVKQLAFKERQMKNVILLIQKQTIKIVENIKNKEKDEEKLWSRYYEKERECNELILKVKQLSEQGGNKDRNCGYLQEQLIRLRRQSSDLKHQYQQSKISPKTITIQYQKYDKVIQSNEKLISKNKEYIDLLSKKSSLNVENQKFKHQLAQQHQELSQLNTTMAQIQQKHKIQLLQHTNIISNLTKEKQELISKTIELIGQIQQQKGKKTDESSNTLLKLIAQKNSQIQQLKKRFDGMSQSRQKQDHSILNQQILNLNKELLEKEQQIIKIRIEKEKQMAVIRNDVGKVDENKIVLNEVLQKLKSELQERVRRQQELRLCISGLQEKLKMIESPGEIKEKAQAREPIAVAVQETIDVKQKIIASTSIDNVNHISADLQSICQEIKELYIKRNALSSAPNDPLFLKYDQFEQKCQNLNSQTYLIQQKARFISKELQKIKSAIVKSQNRVFKEKTELLAILKPCQFAANELINLSETLSEKDSQSII